MLLRGKVSFGLRLGHCMQRSGTGGPGRTALGKGQGQKLEQVQRKQEGKDWRQEVKTTHFQIVYKWGAKLKEEVRSRVVCFVLFLLGEVTAYLFADGNDPVEREKMVMWEKEGIFLKFCI